MGTLDLTRRQWDVLVYMRQHLATQDNMPTNVALAEAFAVSANAAFEVVAALVKKGWLEKIDGGRLRFVRDRVDQIPAPPDLPLVARMTDVERAQDGVLAATARLEGARMVLAEAQDAPEVARAQLKAMNLALRQLCDYRAVAQALTNSENASPSTSAARVE